ncbi:MAG: glycerol-3-phosphate 1-O-acyltransferase PlsY [Clostridiales bacterium]|nr:glycerol-3-phosphate 1-O-acyltransferase PlsY [Clostridiales bacterium]
MIVLAFALTIVIAYFLGGVNSAIIVTKIRSGNDIRDVGSGNAGLTNTLRTQGKLSALYVLIGDVSKGLLAVFIAKIIFYIFTGLNIADVSNGLYYAHYVAVTACTLGHIFPPLYSFKGGKGILVTASALLVAEPFSAIILILIFIALVSLTKYVSVGSLAAAFCLPITTTLYSWAKGDQTLYTNLIITVLLGGLVIFMHRGNIKRLIAGNEKKLGQKE